MPNYDFLLESTLRKQNADLAQRYTSCMSIFEHLLNKFLVVFPTFTDHTLLHTLAVTNISNQLLRENVDKMHPSEIYIFLMAVAMHDIGMGISDKDLDAFIDEAGIRSYVNEHPELSKPTLIRMFHNDFSSAFVKKYWQLFDIPNAFYANAIAEVGQGHRKTDLLDSALYPADYDLGDGNRANLAVLAALIRLADELDIASERNPDLLYDPSSMQGLTQKDSFEFSKHEAIRAVQFDQDVLSIIADTEDLQIAQGIIDETSTIRKTLAYCLSVLDQRSHLSLACKEIKLILNQKEFAF